MGFVHSQGWSFHVDGGILSSFPSLGIYKDYPDEDQQAIYSELAIARESASITCIWQRLKNCQRDIDVL